MEEGVIELLLLPFQSCWDLARSSSGGFQSEEQGNPYPVKTLIGVCPAYSPALTLIQVWTAPPSWTC